jgi:hypothetical protein
MRLAQRSAGEREAALEQCELCGAPIPPAHRHVLELETRDVRCACRPCGLLFDRRAAAEGRYRLIPERAYRIEDMQLDDVMWEELRLPVDIAFFFFASLQERVMAYYPSPMGPTESLHGLEAWEALEAANPILSTLEPDVEALLVDRVKGARRHWIVPVDECYGLVGLIRTRWRGFTGGAEVWEQLGNFFEQLDRRSRPAGRADDRR